MQPAPKGPLDNKASMDEIARLTLERDEKQLMLQQAVRFTNCVRSIKDVAECTRRTRRK